MSLNLYKMVSLLNEHSDPVMDSETYNDLIHGRSTVRSMTDVTFDDVPISIVKSSWDYSDSATGYKLTRKFKFDSFKALFYFISECLKVQQKMNHHCTMLIDENQILISLQTKTVNDVTELDKELSEKINGIYEDTEYFERD
jgi:pterin-4a-carbinolamine dehydratase